MPFDFKKEYREFYLPKDKPGIVTVPSVNYLAVRGSGDPNEESGEYSRAVGLLYGIAYTLRMSRKSGRAIDGFFEYVVPPLEGFWRQEGEEGFDPARKDRLRWISVIRLPDFITRDDFVWALGEAERKKKEDFSPVEFLTLEEGLCVQCMHIGSYDDEPAAVARMHVEAERLGFVPDFSEHRLHHEIYLSDPRRVPPEKRKTVLRHPVRKA